MAFAASNHRAATVCLFTGPTVRAEWNCYCFWSDISGDRLGNPPDGLSWRASSQGKPLRVGASASPVKSVRSLPFLQLVLFFFSLPSMLIWTEIRLIVGHCGSVWRASKSTLKESVLSDKTAGERACQPPKIPSQPSLCSSNRTVSLQRWARWSYISETTFKLSGCNTTRTPWLGSKG